MKKGWEIKKLGDLTDLVTKGTTPTSIGHEFVEKGINFVKVESITTTGEFIEEKFAHITPACHAVLGRSQLQAGDILFSIAGALGRTGFVTDKNLPANTNQALAIIRLKRDVGLSTKFVLKALETGIVLEQIEKFKGGVAQQNLSLAQVRDFQILLPPLPEQRRIVGILDEAFANLASTKANAEKNLQSARAIFESQLNEVFTKKGKGWVEKKLGEALVKTETTDPTRSPQIEFDYIDVSSVSKETLTVQGTQRLQGKDAPSRARKLVKTNDVLFATIRPTLRRIAIIPEELNNQVCSTGYFVLRAKPYVDYRFLFYFLQTETFMSAMETLQKGASYPAVTDGDVRSQSVAIPPLNEQATIVSMLDALSAETRRLSSLYSRKLAALEELKKSLLNQAFTGGL